MSVRIFLLCLFFCLVIPLLPVAAEVESDAELYGEQATPAYRGSGKEWQEQDIRLPPYPHKTKLIKVDLGLGQYPFTVLVDPGSLVVGDDRVVRFTVVLRSVSGVDNIEYQGIRCSQRMVRRYAWGDNGQFILVPNSQWRYIEKNVQDRYLAALAGDFFCPLPGYDREKTLLKKLRRPNPKNFLYDQDG